MYLNCCLLQLSYNSHFPLYDRFFHFCCFQGDVYRYDSCHFGDFSWSDEKKDPVIDSYIAWRLPQVVMSAEVEHKLLDSEEKDSVLGSKAMRMRMKYAVATHRHNTSIGKEEKRQEKVEKSGEKEGKVKTPSRKRKVEEEVQDDSGDDFESLADMRKHILGDKFKLPRRVPAATKSAKKVKFVKKSGNDEEKDVNEGDKAVEEEIVVEEEKVPEKVGQQQLLYV